MRRPVVIVGGGHNGLVAAALLGRAGREVLVLERRPGLGGAAVSEQPFAGHDARLSRYSYLVSLFPRALARELGIPLALADRSVAAYAPYVAADGTARGLLVEQDAASPATRASFRARTGSDADHDAFLAFDAFLGAIAARLFGSFTEPLPTRAQARALLADVPGAWELIAERPLGETLAGRFADDLVRGMISTDGLIGTLADVHEPGLRQNRCFLYHVVGGSDGRWRVPVGGMGAVSAALETAARAAGAELITEAEVLAVDGTQVTWGDAAAAGQHTLTVFALHVTPAMFAAGERAARDTLVNRLLDDLDEHLADPIRDCLARDADGAPCLEAKTPLDLERELELPGGNIFHGDLDWPWREEDDPDRWGVATDHLRILRCGAGARRGGGVSGIGGHNAAMAVLGHPG